MRDVRVQGESESKNRARRNTAFQIATLLPMRSVRRLAKTLLRPVINVAGLLYFPPIEK